MGGGSVIRGTQGEWLFGFANFGGPEDSLRVELWALKIGIPHTWRLGYRPV